MAHSTVETESSRDFFQILTFSKSSVFSVFSADISVFFSVFSGYFSIFSVNISNFCLFFSAIFRLSCHRCSFMFQFLHLFLLFLNFNLWVFQPKLDIKSTVRHYKIQKWLSYKLFSFMRVFCYIFLSLDHSIVSWSERIAHTCSPIQAPLTTGSADYCTYHWLSKRNDSPFY